MVKYVLLILGTIFVLFVWFLRRKKRQVEKKLTQLTNRALKDQLTEKDFETLQLLKEIAPKSQKNKENDMKIIHNKIVEGKSKKSPDKISQKEALNILRAIFKEKPVKVKEQDGSIVDVTAEAFDLKPFTVNNTVLRNSEFVDPCFLGNKYKKQFDLTEQEVKLLNFVQEPTTVFCELSFCLDEVLKLFLKVLKEVDDNYQKEKTSLEEFINDIGTYLVLSEAEDEKYFNAWNRNYEIRAANRKIYTSILKRCENATRQAYHHKRLLKINDFEELGVDNEIKDLMDKVTKALSTQVATLATLDEKTDIELNGLNKGRWKTQLTELKTQFNGDIPTFVTDVDRLERSNKKNSAANTLLFEAAKLMAETNKVTALSFYLKYLQKNPSSDKTKAKKLPKATQKLLFSNDKQLNGFQKIEVQFATDKNLEKAIEKLPEIYVVKRKKIVLDKAKIKTVQKEHSGTVSLLNEYLQEEVKEQDDEQETKMVEKVKRPKSTTESPIIETKAKEENVAQSTYKKILQLNETQIALLEQFVNGNFTLPKQALEDFAQAKGLFKNQLIDQINEKCFELIDDVLIEEEEEHYLIYEEYYKILIKEL